MKKFFSKISFMILFAIILQIVSPIAISCLLTQSYATENKTEVDEEYQKIYNKLMNVLNEKQWNDKVKKVFTDGMKSLSESYDNIYYSFSVIGYPKKEKYIEDNYINPIKKLNEVQLLTDEEIEEMGANVEAYVSADTDGKPYMCLKSTSLSQTGDKYENFLNTILHEIRHVVENGKDYGADKDFLSKTLTEGWAVLGELNMYRRNGGFDVNQFNHDAETTRDGYYVRIGGVGSNTQYAWLGNIMLKLTIIVGYDNMLKCETGEISVSDMIDIVYQKLGDEQANRFMENLETALLNYNSSYIPGMEHFSFKEGTDINRIIETENIILAVLKKRIESANSKEKVQAYFNFYYIYKKFYSVKYLEITYGENWSEAVEKSKEKINIEEIENLLINKSIEYDAISKISNNSNMNKMAIKSILGYEPGLFSGPVNLMDELYKYTEIEENGILKGEFIMSDIEAIFDSEGNMSFRYTLPEEIISTTMIMNHDTEKSIQYIHIASNPSKMTYIQNQEQLDLSGGILEIVYSDNSKDTISLTSEDIKVTGYDNTKVGKNEITIEYSGKETTLSIEIIAKQVTGITIKDKPVKNQYIQNNDKLDLTGGTIEVTYNDGSKDIVSLTNEKIKVTGFDHTKVGNVEISVEYEGKTADFNVTIIANDNASKEKENDKTTSNKELGQYGSKNTIIVCILALTGISILIYRKCKKYKFK